ncbi:hypothetical protein [Thioalkalivibrio sp. ALJ16]|uniref:hypothetical protein n=1 Tax=Thioalkalivibrio sp. ALJ16 TaxID=1158762 RepID=UPI000380D9EB|nr:hypothetical protein [Thioalkalivibrio sp. ALJ16]
MFKKRLSLATLLGLLALPVQADPVNILEAQLDASGPNQWHVSVTVKHPDTGWDHYADAWRVLDADGNVLGERILHHPHVDEQPFTRSLRGVSIPEETRSVQIEARCSQDGWSDQRLQIDLEQNQGKGYRIHR